MIEKEKIFYDLQEKFIINNPNLNIDTNTLFFVQDAAIKKTAQDNVIASNPVLEKDINAINDAYNAYNIALKDYYSALNTRVNS